jgi:hypothetical protein
VRKISTLLLLTAVLLSLSVSAGVFALGDGDDCSACAGGGCTFLCSACTCCVGAAPVASASAPPADTVLTPTRPPLDQRPQTRGPRAILHVPKAA